MCRVTTAGGGSTRIDSSRGSQTGSSRSAFRQAPMPAVVIAGILALSTVASAFQSVDLIRNSTVGYGDSILVSQYSIPDGCRPLATLTVFRAGKLDGGHRLISPDRGQIRAAVGTGDWDNDGYGDVLCRIVPSKRSDESADISGVYSPRRGEWLRYFSSASAGFIGASDGQGGEELATVDSSDQGHVLTFYADGQVEPVGRTLETGFIRCLPVGNLDGNPAAELLVLQKLSSQKLRVSIRTGLGAETGHSIDLRGAYGTCVIALARTGDWDRDGHNDFLVGIEVLLSPRPFESSIAVFSCAGKELFRVEEDILDDWSGHGWGTEFGSSMASIDDIDGDGRPDICVGLPGFGLGGGAVAAIGSARKEVLWRRSIERPEGSRTPHFGSSLVVCRMGPDGDPVVYVGSGSMAGGQEGGGGLPILSARSGKQIAVLRPSKAGVELEPTLPAVSASLDTLKERAKYEKLNKAEVEALAHAAEQRWASEFAGFTYQRVERFSAGSKSHWMSIWSHGKTGLEFVLVPGGRFKMGSPSSEAHRSEYEEQLWVTLDPFLIARTECTQSAWAKVGGDAGLDRSPSYFTGSELPIESVSAKDVDIWCREAGLMLPTEAQWEFACRAGTTTTYTIGDYLNSKHARIGNSPSPNGKTVAAGSYLANAFGMFDVHGNVCEWCRDLYLLYEDSLERGTGMRQGADAVEFRVYRGGSFEDPARFARSAIRDGRKPEVLYRFLGFRPSLDLPW
ncbi:MAG: sulfatase activating formylglycine-generating enzyme [Candidatus Paceibacteria bacterium]|jgi:formylglycine-generating enzyme required for sulfatase activity